MATFDTLRKETDNRGLVRKIQKAMAFLLPLSIDLPDSLVDPTGGIVDIKTLGGLPVGLVTPSGYSFSRDVSKEEVDALGYASAVRSDTTKIERQVTFTALETGRKHMLELALGVDLSGTEQSTDGEVVFDEPDLPVDAEWRLLVIGSDGAAADNWFMGKGFGRVKLAETSEETWGSEDAVQKEYTLDVFTDDEIGTPVRHYMGGTGAVKHKDVLGFDQAA